MITKNAIAQELKAIKEKHGLTNESWSKRSGVPAPTIGRYLSAASLNMPSFFLLGAMLDCLGESLDAFFKRVIAKSGAPADVIKLSTVPAAMVAEGALDVPEAKIEMQERIILQAEEMQRLRASEREKDMQIEMLEAQLEIAERKMEAIKALCSV